MTIQQSLEASTETSFAFVSVIGSTFPLLVVIGILFSVAHVLASNKFSIFN